MATILVVMHVLVVVPARDEQELLPRCLIAVHAAVDHLRTGDNAPVLAAVVVVADRCCDATAEVAGQWPGVQVLVTDHGAVGAARAAGVSFALELMDLPLQGAWIATTDADSVVPIDWLSTHLELARQRADLVLGTVRLDAGLLPPGVVQAWDDAHDLAEGHPHIHGSNLGIRSDVYAQVGGFPPVRQDEDVLLVNAVRAVRGRVVSTSRSPVLTSARLDGRAPAGMSTYLREMLKSTAV